MLAITLLALLQGDPTKPPRVVERRLDAVLAWNAQALDAIRADKTPPPRAARQLAILHAALADTLNAITPAHTPLLVRRHAEDAEGADPSSALAACASAVLSRHHPKHAARFAKLRDGQTGAGPAATRGTRLGEEVAGRYLAWAKDDALALGGAYRAPALVGIWRPTPPARAAALYPEWHTLRPLAIRTLKNLPPVDPPAMNTDEYARDFNEVKSLGGLRSRARSADQTVIALFWNDGPGTCTPPGHWNLIAEEVSLARGLSLQENARLFALLNLALADAGMACWECKYRFRLWRPVTAIHEADRDGNAATEKDAAWSPLLDTPPFPTYTSGHSTFSGAAAAVLAGFFGKDAIPFEVRSDGYPGSLRAYKGFSHAAEEAGRSRIYGGIHFEFDNREGLALGRAVAQEVLRTRLVPLSPRPRP